MQTIKGLSPHKGQMKVVREFIMDSPHTFGVVVSSRQWGKSLLGQHALFYWLLTNNNTRGAWIAPTLRQGKKVFREMISSGDKMIKSANKSSLEIEFVNGSTLIFLSTERHDNIRGFSFNYAVIDEARDIVEDAMLESIEPTFMVQGRKMLIISTPKGKQHWFYKKFLLGKDPNQPEYISFTGKSSDNPRTKTSFLENMRRVLPEGIFKQEYEGEFMDSGNDIFKNIANVAIRDGKTVRKYGEQYYAGIDVGVSNDYTTLTILSGNGRVVDYYRATNKTMEQYARDIVQKLNEYGVAGTYIEVNGVGIGLAQLIEKQYPVEYFHTNNGNKTEGILSLNKLVEDGRIELPSQQWEPCYYNEFSVFSYKNRPNGKITFGAPAGFHDDSVMSTMLANKAREDFGISGEVDLFVGRINY